MLKKTIYHVTHNDLDGVGCNVLMNLYARDIKAGIQQWFCGYDSVDEVIRCVIREMERKLFDYLRQNDEKHPDTPMLELWITDIKMSDEVSVELEAFRVRWWYWVAVFLVDHHKTALSLSEKYPWAHVRVDNDEGIQTCATYDLMLELIPRGLQTSPNLSTFATNVRDYDTFRFTENGNKMAEHLNSLLAVIGHEGFVEYAIDAISDSQEWVIPRDVALQPAIDGYFADRENYAKEKT